MDCGFLVTENEKPDAMVHFVVSGGFAGKGFDGVDAFVGGNIPGGIHNCVMFFLERRQISAGGRSVAGKESP